MSTLQIILTFAGVLGAGGLSYAAARYAGKSSVKIKEIEVDAGAYERAEKFTDKHITRLEKRIDAQDLKLEAQDKQIDGLKRGFRVAINFIEQFLLWERDGSNPPRPVIPESLKEYLDPELIREHQRQQDQMNPKA